MIDTEGKVGITTAVIEAETHGPDDIGGLNDKRAIRPFSVDELPGLTGSGISPNVNTTRVKSNGLAD